MTLISTRSYGESRMENSPNREVEGLLTAAEVASWLSVSRGRVYELKIPRVRISKRSVRFRRCDVADFIENQREPPGQSCEQGKSEALRTKPLGKVVWNE